MSQIASKNLKSFSQCQKLLFGGVLKMSLSLSFSLSFCSSGHVYSSFWSNVSKVTSVLGNSLTINGLSYVPKIKSRSVTHSLSQWLTRSPIELSDSRLDRLKYAYITYMYIFSVYTFSFFTFSPVKVNIAGKNVITAKKASPDLPSGPCPQVIFWNLSPAKRNNLHDASPQYILFTFTPFTFCTLTPVKVNIAVKNVITAEKR